MRPLNSLLAAALSAGLLSACSPPEPDSHGAVRAADEADIAAARAAAGTLGRTLQAELTAAMQAGGPIAAIDVCHERAPLIASDVSAAESLDVGRTALRVRNRDNAADAWERARLDAFAAAMARGEDPASLDHAEIVAVDGVATFRWMKPIPMGDVCAACHGSAIDAEVKAAILARYPTDQATGFEPGSLRGAFTISKPLTD